MFKRVIKKTIDAPSIVDLFQNAIKDNYHVDKSPLLISFINPYSYMVLRDKSESSVSVDIFYSDALSSCLFFSLLAGKKIPRISFDYSSFAKTFLDLISESGFSVFFIGAKDNEINLAMQSLTKAYPKLIIAGYRHGYFSSDEERQQAAFNVAASGATFVVCGMGTPFQEKFGLELKKAKGSIRQIYTCGGFLHQTSERMQYYPELINRFNLRWLYRALKEDYVMKRILIQYPQFLFFSCIDYFKG